jgi:hypothetical protein
VVLKGREWVVTCDVYIGPDSGYYGARWLRVAQSKWFNHFGDLKTYEDFIRTGSLWGCLHELSGMTLGYTKAGGMEHGVVLQRLFAERFNIAC